MTSKVNSWSHHVELLSSVTMDQPQVAYVALTESLQHEWIFLQRVTENCTPLFKPVKDSLSSTFIPSLFGHN